LQHILFIVLGHSVGNVGGVCSNVVGVAGGAVGGGGVDGCYDMSELARETSPSPASCRISAMTGESLDGSIGGWRYHLRFTGRLMAPWMQRALRSALAAFVFSAAFVVAAAALGAAAAGAAVAAKTATAA
jgi:hypothetical protein